MDKIDLTTTLKLGAWWCALIILPHAIIATRTVIPYPDQLLPFSRWWDRPYYSVVRFNHGGSLSRG